MSGVKAVGSTDPPDLFISRGFFHFFVQEELNRAFHVLAVFPALVFDIPIYRCHT